MNKAEIITSTVAPGSAQSASQPAVRRVHAQIPDDKDMLRTAAALTRDLATARPSIYWTDLIASALAGYGALALVIVTDSVVVGGAAALVSILALYRALLFIHELTHIHRDALPGFRFGWNLLVGIPMLMPSFMYEGVHTLHHARTRYGTAEDPEYLPLALMKPWTLPLFVFVSMLAPLGLLLRSAVLVPLGALIPPLRRIVWARASALSINPDFRRRPAEGDFAVMVRWQELGASLWAIGVLGASALWLGWRPLLLALAVLSAVAVLNQLRTLVAHLWENDGEAMTVTAQFLDSVNVPPPGMMAWLWAPIGLRFHALHHLMPSLPYHALGEAHARLRAQLGDGSTYDEANHPGLAALLARIMRSTFAQARGR